MVLAGDIAKIWTVSQVFDRRKRETAKSQVAHRSTFIWTRDMTITIPKGIGVAQSLVALSGTQPVCKKKNYS